MNILLIAPQPFFQNRGTPIAVKLLSETLGGQSHCIHLLTYHEGEDIRINNTIIHRIPNIWGVKNIPPGFSFKKLTCDLFVFFKCFKIIKQNNIHMVHAVEEAVFIAMFFKFIFGLPYIYDMDSSLSDQITEKFPTLKYLKKGFCFFEKKAVQNSRAVIAVCRALEEKVRQYSSDTKVLRLEDVSMLNKKTSYSIALKKTLGIEGTLIMYVGNLEKYQGIDLLLDSFKIACMRISAVHLVIIGGTIPDIEAYKKKAGLLKIEDRVFFMGPKPIDQLYAYLSNADILVSPRVKGNNTPMKIYSYLDSGKPVVATRLSTHMQVMDENIAMLTNPDPSAMADCFIKLIQNPGLAPKIVYNAQKCIEENYSKEVFQKKLLNFYSQFNHFSSPRKSVIQRR